MTSRSSSLAPLVGRDLAEYGVVRLRDQAFDAVQRLWRKRRGAGVTQKALADAIGRDPGWVSRNLRAPGNWTLRTIGELIQALGGEAEIKVVGLEEPIESPSNFDVYCGWDDRTLTSSLIVDVIPNPLVETLPMALARHPEISTAVEQHLVGAGL